MSKRTFKDFLMEDAERDRKFNKGRAKLRREIRRETIVNAAHLLNRLRMVADESDSPLSPQEENAFWAFIGLLSENDKTSVIN